MGLRGIRGDDTGYPELLDWGGGVNRADGLGGIQSHQLRSVSESESDVIRFRVRRIHRGLRG